RRGTSRGFRPCAVSSVTPLAGPVRGVAHEVTREPTRGADHTVGYPDLIFTTTWVQGRRSPLKVFGPAGLEDLTRHIMLAWQADIDILTRGMERRARTEVEAHDASRASSTRTRT